MEQNGTREDPTAMTVLAAEREGQDTEMSGCCAQDHRTATEAVEHAHKMLGCDGADRDDLMRTEHGHVVWE